MVLKGNIYIFVEPNQDNILAYFLKSQEIFQPMKIYYYPQEMNVNFMKNIVPFYA